MTLSSIPLLVIAAWIAPDEKTNDWTQWGGPTGDFMLADSPPLADEWPEAGPARLWERELGDGYSAILVRDGRLFTMYREEQVEIVVALDAKTGELIWDYAYEAGRYPDMTLNFGEGPNATSLLIGDRLVSIGITGILTCLDPDDGEPIWELDLHEEYGRQKRREEYGYSGIPLAYDGNVLVMVGGDKHAIVAFDPKYGDVVWASAPGRVSYAPPRMIRLHGMDQYVYYSPTEIIGMDPTDGTLLWSYPVECGTENNLTTPMLCADDHLWVACQLDGGTRVLEILQVGDDWAAEATWTSRTIKQGHWPSIRMGDYVYGSLGDSSSMLGAVNWRTGETAWKERGYHAAQGVYADGKYIFVDEAGQVAMARLSPEGIEILGSAQVLEEISWTAPTLVGSTLYVRDRKRIVALDLARGSSGG